jgi:transposase
MNLYSGARSCLRSRALLIERITVQGWAVARAASAAGISRHTAHKWLARYRAEGAVGLQDRRSRPAPLLALLQSPTPTR